MSRQLVLNQFPRYRQKTCNDFKFGRGIAAVARCNLTSRGVVIRSKPHRLRWKSLVVQTCNARFLVAAWMHFSLESSIETLIGAPSRLD